MLCRWVLSVKKNYRPVKYHNWRHALNVCQTMFAMVIQVLKWSFQISPNNCLLSDEDRQNGTFHEGPGDSRLARCLCELSYIHWPQLICLMTESFVFKRGQLCHDLDHRGTNNAFQLKTDSPLAILYTTSTMEHHHFDQCVMILNSEGNNIFQVSFSFNFSLDR